MVAQIDPVREGEKLISGVKRQAVEVAGQVGSELKMLRREAKKKVKRAGKALRREAGRVVEDQKKLAAEQLKNAGSVVHRTAKILEGGSTAGLAEYVEMAADRADAAANYLRNKDAVEISNDAARFARRHPAPFFTGMLVAGMVFGRLARMAGEQVRRK